MRDKAVLRARVEDGKQEAGAKFADYFDHAERWANAPSHRALAMLRGRNEGFLTLELEVDAAEAVKPVERMIAEAYAATSAAPGDAYLRDVARWTWRVKLSTSLSLDLMTELRERSEEEAIKVFAHNLKDLLLAAPAGARPTLGLDPGMRTGVKVAAIDATGKVVDTTTVYPFQPRNDLRGAQAALAALIAKHGIELIAIGNGTASRETERLVADLLARASGQEADESYRQRSGRLGLFRLGAGGGGVSRPRRVAARRGVDRAASARPARRTRQDRAEVDRRRPVPARRRRVQARPLARRRGRGRGQRGRRRSQHGVAPPCSRASPASAPRSPTRSSRIATLPGRSRAAERC